jgi:hypothetical protein
MTAEQKAENVALLARMVMKWDLEPVREGFRVRLPDGGLLFLGERPTMLRRWDPYVSIADAMEMLDRLEEYSLDKERVDFYHCEVMRSPYFTGQGDTAREAICSACLEWARAQGERG